MQESKKGFRPRFFRGHVHQKLWIMDNIAKKNRSTDKHMKTPKETYLDDHDITDFA